MYMPCRGGVRGGKDQFTWESVKSDKDRECYLGHSLMAPVGRWQEGKDLTWYAKENKDEANNKKSEFLQAKELEEKALMAALGYSVKIKSEEEPEQESNYEYENRNTVHKRSSKSNYQRNYFSKNYSKNQIDKLIRNLLEDYSYDEINFALKSKTKGK